MTNPTQLIISALETGVDLARGNAEAVHANYKGYYPERHAAADRDVSDMEAALAAARAHLEQPTGPLQWCEKCAELVTDFCRGKGGPCAYGFDRPGQATEPAPKGLFIDLIAAQGPDFVAEMAAIKIEPAPSNDVCRNCAGQGWEPSVYKGKAPCSFCRAAPSTAGERVEAAKLLIKRADDAGSGTRLTWIAIEEARHIAALLQSTALPVGELTLPEKRDIGDFDPKKSGSVFFRGLGWNEAIDEVAGLLAAARPQPVLEPQGPAPTNCRNCGGPDNVLCGGQCQQAARGITQGGKV